MKKIFKRISAITMAATMATTLAISAIAVGFDSSVEKISAPLVYSPEFPEAYIIPNESAEWLTSDSTTQTVSATVFVEEEYGLDDNGNPITTSSRLLSKDEVLAIGLDNFGDMEDARQKAVLETLQTRAATNARGNLTISFSGTYSISGNSVSCDLSGSASWTFDTWGQFNGKSNPATGSDYMGVSWSGGFTTSSSPTISATSSFPIYEPPVLNMCDSVPNAGRVWEFREAWTGGGMMGQSVSVYLKSIDVNVKLIKNKRDNSGNTAEAVLKYIHTYELAHGSISITASSSGVVGGGFSLSSVDKQWSLVCTVTGIPS